MTWVVLENAKATTIKYTLNEVLKTEQLTELCFFLFHDKHRLRKTSGKRLVRAIQMVTMNIMVTNYWKILRLS